MDCDEARPLLPLVTRTDESWDELRAVRDHLTGCPACQAAFDAELRHDRELAERLLAVPVPTELPARLSRDVAAIHHPAIHRPATQEAAPRIRRRRWSVAWGVMSVVLLCGFLSWRLLLPDSVSIDQVVTAIGSLEVSSGWGVASGFDRPAGWSQIRGLRAEEPRWAQDTPVSMQVVQFSCQPARSGSPVAGQLWIVDARSISSAAEIPALEFAQIRYTPGQPHLVWSERGVIYVLVASGDVVALEHLQLALRKSRSIA